MSESAPRSGSPLSRRVILVGSAALLAGCIRRGPEPAPIAAPAPTALKPPEPEPAPAAPAKPPARPQVATVEGDGYVLVRREAWAVVPVKDNNLPMGRITRITVHHTGEYAAWDDIPDVEVVKRIDRYHREDRYWAAIGYHFLVGRDGKVYEGRPAKYQGAHVSGANEQNLGISVIGDYNAHLPVSRQLAALKAILDEKRKQYRVPLDRVYGHRDLHSSECPGNALYAWVKQYKAG